MHAPCTCMQTKMLWLLLAGDAANTLTAAIIQCSSMRQSECAAAALQLCTASCQLWRGGRLLAPPLLYRIHAHICVFYPERGSAAQSKTSQEGTHLIVDASASNLANEPVTMATSVPFPVLSMFIARPDGRCVMSRNCVLQAWKLHVTVRSEYKHASFLANMAAA